MNPARPFLARKREGAILHLWLDRPETRNVLTEADAIEDLVDAFAAAERDETIRVIVLAANGPAFSAGGDLRAMKKFAAGERSEAEIERWYRDGIHRVVQAVHGASVPTIAAVNGPAVGAGCDLACMCDLRIAGRSAWFAESFVQLGLVSGDGGSWMLPRIVGWPKAMEMSFTGDRIGAEEALHCGLVGSVVDDAALHEAAASLARRIAKNPAAALRNAKRLLRESQSRSFDDSLALAAHLQARAHLSAEHREALAALAPASKREAR